MHKRVIRAKTLKASPNGDAEATRRWKYKEKRPTKVTIYNRCTPDERAYEKEEEEGHEEEETATRCAEERAVRHEDGDILIMEATKRGRREE